MEKIEFTEKMYQMLKSKDKEMNDLAIAIIKPNIRNMYIMSENGEKRKVPLEIGSIITTSDWLLTEWLCQTYNKLRYLTIYNDKRIIN